MNFVAIVSGGMDSVTMLHDLVDQGYGVRMITFDYGEPNKKEIACARWHANELDLDHEVVDISFMKEMSPKGLMLTMLSIATSYGLKHGCDGLALGLNAIDQRDYQERGDTVLRFFKRTVIRSVDIDMFMIQTPFMASYKEDIVSMGYLLGIDYTKTWSCNEDGEKHCGKCPSCVTRREGFKDANVIDPTPYADDYDTDFHSELRGIFGKRGKN